jgi:hypothetical protein
MAAPWFQRAFDTLPITLAMVELDRLVVFQPNVTLDFVDQLKARLGPDPDPNSLFRFCLPLERPEPPVKVRRLGSRRYQYLPSQPIFAFSRRRSFRPTRSATTWLRAASAR